MIPRLRVSPRAVPPAVLAVVAAFLLREVLFEGRVFYARDIHLQWVIQAEAFVRSMAAGSWPVWNRLVSFGQPLIANPNNQVFYPFTWLNVALQPWNYYTAFVAAHLGLAAAGLYRLSRRLGLSRTASTTAAATWMASGPLLSLVNLWNHLAGASWIGWSGWAADRAASSGRPGAALLWGATLAAPVLAGSPEAALMAGGVGVLVACRHARHRLFAVAKAATVAAGFALALSAAQWIPSVELAQRSMRAQISTSHSAMWSVPAPLLAQMVAPARLDTLPAVRPDVRARLFEGREPFLSSIYLGLAAAAFVAAAAAGGGPVARAGVALWLLCVLTAMGRHGWVYSGLVALVPGLQSLRYPAKAMILGGACWAVAVGFGIDAVARHSGAAQRALRLTAATLAAVVGAAGVLLWYGASAFGHVIVATDQIDRPLRAVFVPVAAGLLVAGMAGLAVAVAPSARRAMPATGAAIVLGGLVVADLAFAHRSLNPTAEPELMRFRPPALAHLADKPPLSRVYSYDYASSDGRATAYLGHEGYVLKAAPDRSPTPWAHAAALRTALFPTVLGYWGLESAYSIDQLGLFSPELHALTWFVRAREGTPIEHKLLQMGAVSRVVSLHRQGFEGLPLIARVPTLLTEDLLVLDVPHPLPRVYAVHGVRVAPRYDALRAIDDPTFDPRREVILPTGTASPPDPAFAAATRVDELLPDRTSITAELSAAGYVVVVDTYDPGWRATVDGVAAPLLRANMAFQAVPVGPGRHRIELAYRPRSVTIGVITTLGALACALAVAAWGARVAARESPY